MSEAPSRHRTSFLRLVARPLLAALLILPFAGSAAAQTADPAGSPFQAALDSLRVAQEQRAEQVEFRTRAGTFDPCEDLTLGCNVCPPDQGTLRCFNNRIEQAENAVRATLEAAHEATVDLWEGSVKATNTALASTGDDLAELVSAVEDSLGPAIDELLIALEEAEGAFTMEWQREFLAGVQQLGLDGVITCMQNQNVDLAAEFAAFSQNPAGFIGAQADAITQQMATNLQGLIGDDIAAITNGQFELPGNTRDIVLLVIEKMGILAQGTGPAECAYAFVHQHRHELANQLADLADELMATIRQEAEDFVDESIRPAIEDTINDAIGGFLEEDRGQASSMNLAALQDWDYRNYTGPLKPILPTPEEVRMIARGVLLEQADEAIEQLLPDLEQLIAEVQAGQVVEAGGAVQTSANNIQGYVMSFTQGDPDYKETYAAIFFEVVRSIGHKAIYSKEAPYVGWMTTEAIKMLSYVEDTVAGLIEGVCGFIPEVGGIISAVVLRVVDLLWSQAEMLLESALQAALDNFWNDQVTSIKDDFLAALGTVPPGTPPTAVTIDRFLASLPHDKLLRIWTGLDLDEDRQQIDRLMTAVSDLASATAE